MNQSSQLLLMIPCLYSCNEHNNNRDLISPYMDSLSSRLVMRMRKIINKGYRLDVVLNSHG